MKLAANDEMHEIKHYWLTYTALTILLVLASYCHFWFNGKTAVGYYDIDLDGYSQHLTGLIFYAQWLRGIIKNLLVNHVFEIPSWSFQIGYGADVVTTLQFYVVGDPFALPAVLVPTKYIPYFYELSSYARVWCAGLAFSAWCLKSKKLPEKGVLAGAISYAFCAFALTAAVRHPNFITAMVWLPLLLWGIDKVIDGKSPWLFIAVVCIAVVSNFYFFYIVAVLAFLYGMLELLVPLPQGRWKKIWLTVAKLFGFGILGVLLSSVLLVPELILLFGGSRISTHVSYGLFYPIQYYESFISSYFSFVQAQGGSWSNFGYAVPALLAVIILYLDREKSVSLLRLKLAFAILTLFLLFPAVQSFFNGFSYPTARWHFGYSLLIAVIFAKEWKQLFALDRQQIRVALFVVCGIFFVCLLLDRSRSTNVAFQLALLAITLILISARADLKVPLTASLVIVLTMISVSINALFGFSPLEGNLVTNYADRSQMRSLLHPKSASLVSKEAIKNHAPVSRYAYLADDSELKANLAMLRDDVFSTGYYWSLLDGAQSEYANSMLIEAWSNYVYTDPDRRTALMELGSVRYAVDDSNNIHSMPFGYQKTDTGVFINQYALPFGYTYDSYILRSKFDRLSPLKRQEALLQTVALADATTADLEKYELHSDQQPSFSSVEVPYSLSLHDEGISETSTGTGTGRVFVVSQPGAKVTLNFEGVPHAETYLSLSNLRFKGFSQLQLYTEDPQFDPNNLYGGLKGPTDAAHRWDDVSIYNQNSMIRADKYYQAPSRFRIGLDVENTHEETITRNFSLVTPQYSWYNGRKDFLVNLYYDENPKTSLTITFPQRGIYRMDDMSVFCQPMDAYPNEVAKLSKEFLTEVDLHSKAHATNKVTGSIDLASDKILCLSIPYSKGWSATVDGKKAELYQANIMYMGLPLKAGHHSIELRYETPGRRLGWMLTGGGVVIALSYGVVRRRKKSRETQLR